MYLSDVSSKVTKSQLSSVKQIGPLLDEITSYSNDVSIDEENKKLFEDLLDVDKMQDSQGEGGDKKSVSSSVSGSTSCTNAKSLSASMHLYTPGNHSAQFPVIYCCCRRVCSHGNPHYGNQLSSSTTIDPVCLSHKETVEPQCPFIQQSSLLACDSSSDPPPLTLLQPRTNALQHHINDYGSQKSARQVKPSLTRSSQHKGPSSPPETVIRGLTLAGNRKCRRSKTSYDPKTSYLLNTLFFESFGNERKPTKLERRKVQHKTGISSRHLTYWLSNHKRRFRPELMAYQRLQRSGRIKSYDEFMDYCKNCHVPEISFYKRGDFGEGSSLPSDGEEACDADVDTDHD
ncbi:hypothetical protein BJV82DRAFT_670412 [Fennellomyces sp. T-0311]|nr:hypothetical protein BJV82DRAFT_670412 [Fennellomyces sp. T-0311]